MPPLKRRPTHGPGPDANVLKSEGGQPSNGVQQFDGRKNTNAGTPEPNPAFPKDLEGPGKRLSKYFK